MTIIFAMSDNFCIFAVENELTLMLRQNGHNSLIITPPQFTGLVNGKSGKPTIWLVTTLYLLLDSHHPAASGRTQEYAPTLRAYTGVRPYGGGAALFCCYIEIHEIHK